MSTITSTTNSSGLLGDSGWCLICCSSYTESKLLTNNLNWFSNSKYDNNNRLTKAIEKIFEYLLVPKEHLVKVKNKQWMLYFCPNCMVFVEDIIDLQNQAEILELKIRWKIETLGRNALNTRAFTRKTGRDRKEVQEVWNTFKAHVTRNFLQGLLPNPSVRLEKTVDVETKAVWQLGKVESVTKSVFKSNSQRIEIEINTGDEDSSSEADLDFTRLIKRRASARNVIESSDSDCTRVIERQQFFKKDNQSSHSILEGCAKSIKIDKTMNEEEPEEIVMPEYLDEDDESNENVFQKATVQVSDTLTGEIPGETINLDTPKTIKNLEIPQPQEQNGYKITAPSNPVLEPTHENSIVDHNTAPIPKIEQAELDKGTEKTPEVLENMQIPSLQEQEESPCSSNTVLPSNNTPIPSTHNTYIIIVNGNNNYNSARWEVENKGVNYNVSQSVEATTYPHTNDTNYEEISVENKIWLGNTDNIEEIDESFSQIQEHFMPEENNEEVIPVVEKCVTMYNESRDISETEPMDYEIEGRSEENMDNPFRDEKFDNDLRNTVGSADEIEIYGLGVTPPSKKRKLDKVPKKPANIDKFVEHKAQKELEELIEGRDYFKCTKCDYFARKNSISSSSENRPTRLKRRVADHYSSRHNPVKHTYKSETIDGKYCYKCTKCSFSIDCQSETPSAPTPADCKCSLRKLSLHYMEFHDNSDFYQNSNRSLPKPQQYMTSRLKHMDNSVRKTSRLVFNTRGTDKVLEELEGLIEGCDYFKCTKCSYFAKKMTTYNSTQNCPSRLRTRVADHYTRQHNPVKTNNKSTTIGGKYFYRCTKCSFSVVLRSNTPSACRQSRRKLSFHYMQFHDALEKQFNPNPNSNCSRLTSLTEGMDYFACPVSNCTFVALINRDDNPRQQLENAVEARHNLIDHYRSSRERLHFNERKQTLSQITLISRDAGVNFYNCTKCNFKSVVRKRNNKGIFTSPKVPARKEIMLHYLLEHVFPWESFPSLYKYGCYEEKCEDGNFLKCFYSDCDYFIKIQNGVEGKTEEDCLTEAYQIFSDNHARNHNFNSIGFGDSSQFFTQLAAREGLNDESVSTSRQAMEFNEELENNVRFQPSDPTINKHINNMVPEEIVVDIKPWFGDFEEPGEMDKIFTGGP